MKNKKKKYFILAMMACLAFILWLIRPLSFESVISSNDNLSIVNQESYLVNGIGKLDTVEYQFSRDSQEFEKILNILKKYTYHRCLNTFTNKTNIDSWGNSSILRLNIGKTLIIMNGESEILINGRIYRIGYFGNTQASKLIKEIKAELGKKIG